MLFGIAPTAPAAPCDQPVQTPVLCENSKPGNPPSDSETSGQADTSIERFATDISVNRGETVRFKVDTDPWAYRIDIGRLGYYWGDGARL